MNTEQKYLLTLDDIGRGITKLPSLPAVVIELLQSIDKDVDTDILAEKISRDQALVAKILQVANSPFYGLRGKIDSIPDAVIVLGIRGVRTLATAAAVTGSFGRGIQGGLDYRIFWRHSIGVALCAKALATRSNLNEDNAFVVGLLHDIGRLVLASCFPQHMDAVLDYQKRLDCQMIEAEHAVLGIDHAQIGQTLLASWNFPEAIHQAIAWHHTPGEQSARSLACLLHVADAMVHALDLVGDENEMAPRIDNACWHSMAPSWRESGDLFANLESHFESACDILAG